MYPVKLQPIFKNYIWGGTKLKKQYGKKSSFSKVAESWELACSSEGMSIAANGSLKGLALSRIVEKWGKGCLGENCKQYDRFPLLIKFIDSNDSLSVQVHPDDEYAFKRKGDYGKTEMWYIVQADEGASILYGFKKNTTKKEITKRLCDGTLLDIINCIPVKAGDSFVINAGLVHAIEKGIVAAEIQQNSNITYRLYDYGRKDINGNQRELHIEDALGVLNYNKTSIPDIPRTEHFENTA